MYKKSLFIFRRDLRLEDNIGLIQSLQNSTEVIPTDVVIPNSEFLSCSNTNVANVWTVITRGPYGPFGLIAEEYEDGKFRGFFTLNSNVCRHALNVMGKTLGSKFDIQ